MGATRRAVLILCLISLAVPAFARGKKSGSTDAGKYTDWKGEIDELEIVQPFKIADYEKVVVAKFDSSGTRLPEEKDNSYKPVMKVLGDAATPFTKGLAGQMKSISVAQ